MTRNGEMMKLFQISKQNLHNWLIDLALFVGAVIASLTGIYFLFLPVGGYQGGRNPAYGIKIVWERTTWDDLHTWFGILMIAAAAVHILIHWGWIVSMAKRIFRELIHREKKLHQKGRYNVVINALIASSFLITAASGVFLLFFPGGRYGVPDPIFLVSRTTWDLIHAWVGIVMMVAGVLHFAIHWRWVTNVTRKIFQSFHLYPPQKKVEREMIGS